MQPVFAASLGTDLSNIATETATKFGLDWPHFIAQCVSFLIVTVALCKWGYKPVLGVLEERRQRIAEGLANAEKIKKELASTETKCREILSHASAQADEMIGEARAAAANDIVTKARQAMEAEHARMLTDLRREVGRLVVATTGKVAGKVLSTEDQQRLAEEANRQVAA